jgi:hypothetical protein
MAEQRERKPGTGVAFTNKNKKEDWHADWTGEFADLQGNIYYLNVSKKVSGHSNQEYISVSLGKPKVAKYAPSNASPKPIHEMIDDIPF